MCGLVNGVVIVLGALSLRYNWCDGYSCLFVSLVVRCVRVDCFEFVCFLVLGLLICLNLRWLFTLGWFRCLTVALLGVHWLCC